MSLADIIQKERTIYTPLAQEVADSPDEQEQKFKFHVDTYVAIADVKSRWEAILNSLLKGQSVTGLIYADTGYGKTSTGVSLWNYAEENGIVTVPPFMWNSLEDLLVATHGWVLYRLNHTRPDLVPKLEEKYKAVVAFGEEVLAEKMSREKSLSVEQAQEATAFVKAEGLLREDLSPHGLLDYLRFATEQVLAAHYKGLMILPDEFQLFRNNPDTAQNYDRLKQFIFGIHGEEKLPIGCIALTYRETFASIRESEYNYLLARFAKPTGNLIDLQSLYGEPGFAKSLWNKLADLCSLSLSEKSAIDNDVLDALGQFLRHSRARALMSGPRSVIETFRRAALHYTEKNCSYSLFDFCEDYLAGNIAFSSQHTEAAQAHTQIMALPSVNTPEKQKIVKLLCVHPEGVPPALFQKYGISASDRDNIVQSLLGVHVITKGTSTPTLACYRDDLLGVDSLNEILKRLRERFNPENKTVHYNSVRAFHKHIFPQIFTPRKQGTLLGWTGMQEVSEKLDGGCTMNLTGAPPNLREYPNRTLRVNINTQEIAPPPLISKSQLQVQFILNTIDDVINSCHVTTNGLEFRFNLRKPINPQRVPKDIGKLTELFLPENITPLLLLSILDFFDKDSIIAIVKGAKQEAQVHSLTDLIRGELIRYFFSPEVKENMVEHSADLASVPAGKDFVEGTLKVLIPKQFPNYYAVAIAKGWENNLGIYKDAFGKAFTLGMKRGKDPIKAGPKLFNMGQVAFENFCDGVARNLLRVEYGSSKQDETDIYFILHPFEEALIERLESNSSTILVGGKQIKTTELSEVYKDAKNLGYLDKEVDELLAILKARGIAGQQQVSGTEYLYLEETSINLADLETKLKGIEEDVTLAESNGFQYQCPNLSSARKLIQTLGIENDEMQKDALRQNLNLAEELLKEKCAEWIKRRHENLRQKVNILETFHLQIPTVLEQQTGYPLTEFSQILFQSVQPEVKRAYTKISDQIRRIQERVRETCDREVVTYQSDQTPRKAIETASRLQQACVLVDADIEELDQERKDAEELHHLFRHWRDLAHQVEGDGQRMVNNQEERAVKNVVDRFNVIQQQIRDHLGEKRIPFKDVLGAHEHFKVQIDEIKSEFDQYLGGKEKAFIADQANIEELLAKVIDMPHVGVKWNPSDIDGCYRETREKVVEKLRNVIDTALSQLDNVNRALLGPIETYAVPESLKSSAIQLRDDVGRYSGKFQGILPNLITENVDPQLSNWVSELITLRQKGEDIWARWKEMESDMTGFRNQLSSSTQKLHDAVNPLLDDGTFNSPSEIIERLEELYQLR